MRRYWPYFVVGAVALLQWFNLYRFAVDIPYWDEWEFLEGILRTQQTGSPRWFFEPANEHLLVLTKIEIYLAYLWNGWNVRTLQIFNFTFFLAVLAAFWAFVSKAFPDRPRELVLFFVFLLSPIPWENHLMSSQSCLRLAMLFTGFAAYFLLNQRQTWGHLLLGCLSGTLATYAFGTGMIGGVIVGAIFVLYKTLLAIKDRPALKHHAAQGLVVVALLGLNWFGFMKLCVVGRGFRFAPPSWPLAEYFLNLVSLGYGLDSLWVLGGVGFLFSIPLLGLLLFPFVKTLPRLEARHWTLFAWSLAMLANAALTAIGRVGMGMPTSKLSRYYEYTMMLVPITAVVLYDYLKKNPLKRRRVLTGFSVFVFLCFADNWTFHQYKHIKEIRLENVECAYGILLGKSQETICKHSSPYDLRPYLDRARVLKLSFIKSMPGR